MPLYCHLECGKCLDSIQFFFPLFFMCSSHFINIRVFLLGSVLSRFSFDWKNPSGYLLAVGIQTAMAFCVYYFLTCFAALTLGCFLFSFSFSKEMCKNLRSLNEMAKTSQSEANIFKECTEFISFHSRLKQLS